MSRPFDRNLFIDFAAEVRSMIPALLDDVVSASALDGTPEQVYDAFRAVHTIKGAAGLAGLSVLSHLANQLEEILDRAVTAGPPLAQPTMMLIATAAARIEAYLDARLADQPTDTIVAELLADVRRFDGLPEAGDAAAVAELFEASGEMPSSSAPAADAPPVLPSPPATVAAEDFEIDVRPSSLASSDLAEVFSEEAHEHLRTISGAVSQLRSSATDTDALQELRRAVHTLKGAAGTVGFKAVSQLAHRMEDLLDRLSEGTASMTSEAQRVLFAAADAFDDLISGTGDDTALTSTLRSLYRSYDALLAGPMEAPAVAAVGAAVAASSARTADVPAHGGGTPARDARTDDAAETITLPELRSSADRRQGDRRKSGDRRGAGQAVRVPFERVDDVVKLVSELVINRSTFEQHFGGLIRQVDELGLSMARLRRVAAKIESEYEVGALAGQGASVTERTLGSGPRLATFATHGFDELELDRYTEFHLISRELTETASDIHTVGSRLRDTIEDFESDLTRLGRLTGDVQDKVMQFRMLPLATLATRLERTVRVTAADRGKQAHLVLEGEHIALDKAMLEGMSDPLQHLLRNAVDHGLETPDVRRAAGKPESGRIVVRAYYEGTQVVIEIQDDGAGLDAGRIRSTAVARGLVDAQAAQRLTDEEVLAFVFEPGFSTARELSEISGRGVGLDIVKSMAEKLKGRIRVDSTPGQGARFTVRLPMTLAVARVLLLRAGGQTLAMPMGAIVQIVKLGPTAIGRIDAERVVTIEGRAHPMVVLADVLGLPHAPESDEVERPILIVNLGDRRIAVAVDEIVESRDAVVKTLGGHLRHVQGVTGATLLGDGAVVLILNPADLAREVARPRAARSVSSKLAGGHDPYTVMVVDDSLSVRHVLSGLVRKAGWNVLQARDGVEALEVLQRAARNPDVILLDIEMPRMDGYELTSTLRGQDGYRDIPIVMLTSRAGDKHRQKAFALGATDYLVKPYQDDVLLERVERLARTSRAKGAAA
jgi:chemosensory pili system protein ChpA (sensor histidine kinase/response regulator)